MAEYQGIFGTPPEPFYNTKPHLMKDEVLADWLNILREENLPQNRTVSYKTELFKTENVAEFIFLTCNQFGLSPHARYLAVEIFNRFIGIHLTEIYKYVLDTHKTGRNKEMRKVLERVKSQVHLRAVTCCQIASKLTSHYKIITIRKANRQLERFQHRYSTLSLLNSEMRVLKVVDHKVAIKTPLIYIETLLEIIGRSDSEVEVKTLHHVCLLLLDVMYIERDRVYAVLYKAATGHELPAVKQRDKFWIVMSDLMLQSAAIIAAACCVINYDNTPTLISGLSSIANMSDEDIVDLASAIMQVAVVQE